MHEADDLVAGHRHAALRQADEHVVEALDVDADAIGLRPVAARAEHGRRELLLVVAAAEPPGDALGDAARRHVVLADRGQQGVEIDVAVVGDHRLQLLGRPHPLHRQALPAKLKEKRSGIDAGRPTLKACLEYLREGDTLVVSKLDRLARSTSDLYRIVSELTQRGVEFKVLDDPSIDTSSRTGKLVMGILALIAEFKNDIRRERRQDGNQQSQGGWRQVRSQADTYAYGN